VLIAARYGGHDVKLDENFDFGTSDKERQVLSFSLSIICTGTGKV
jgi:hypothetical protein